METASTNSHSWKVSRLNQPFTAGLKRCHQEDFFSNRCRLKPVVYWCPQTSQQRKARPCFSTTVRTRKMQVPNVKLPRLAGCRQGPLNLLEPIALCNTKQRRRDCKHRGPRVASAASLTNHRAFKAVMAPFPLENTSSRPTPVQASLGLWGKTETRAR